MIMLKGWGEEKVGLMTRRVKGRNSMFKYIFGELGRHMTLVR